MPGYEEGEHWRAISQAQLSLMWGMARKVAGEKAWTSTSLTFILSGHVHQFLPLVTTLKLKLHNPKRFLLKLEVSMETWGALQYPQPGCSPPGRGSTCSQRDFGKVLLEHTEHNETPCSFLANETY